LDGYYYAARIRGQRIYIMEKQDLVVDYGRFSGKRPIESKMPKMARYAISAYKQ